MDRLRSSVILFIKIQDIFIDISNQHYNIEWSLSKRLLVHYTMTFLTYKRNIYINPKGLASLKRALSYVQNPFYTEVADMYKENQALSGSLSDLGKC